MIEVIEHLIGKGYDLHMIDKNSWPAWSAPIEISSSITFRTYPGSWSTVSMRSWSMPKPS